MSSAPNLVNEPEVITDEEHLAFGVPLPPHVTALLYRKYNKGFKMQDLKGRPPEGIYAYHHIQKSLEEPPVAMPHLRTKEEKDDQRVRDLASKRMSMTTRLPVSKLSLSLSPRSGTKASSIDESILSFVKTRTALEKVQALERMIDRSINKKVAFHVLAFDSRSMPSYVSMRLETACRSARFELPMDLHLLAKITPLEYLSTYTRLVRDQRLRYEKIYKRFKHRTNNYIEFNNLYLALNAMFGGCLGKVNFHILCTALLIDETIPMNVDTFVGVCTYCDRLFWSGYLDGANSFNCWAPNRDALEALDFANLSWKLHGVNISTELRIFLFSLG